MSLFLASFLSLVAMGATPPTTTATFCPSTGWTAITMNGVMEAGSGPQELMDLYSMLADSPDVIVHHYDPRHTELWGQNITCRMATLGPRQLGIQCEFFFTPDLKLVRVPEARRDCPNVVTNVGDFTLLPGAVNHTVKMEFNAGIASVLKTHLGDRTSPLVVCQQGPSESFCDLAVREDGLFVEPSNH